jgi:hypothetical protein
MFCSLWSIFKMALCSAAAPSTRCMAPHAVWLHLFAHHNLWRHVEDAGKQKYCKLLNSWNLLKMIRRCWLHNNNNNTVLVHSSLIANHLHPFLKTWFPAAQFLDASAKLRKATITFVMSICLSVCPSVRPPARMEQLGYHWADFQETWNERFSKICQEN